MLEDAIARNIPVVTDIPTIIFGADVSHPQPGEDSSPSMAAVCSTFLLLSIIQRRCTKCSGTLMYFISLGCGINGLASSHHLQGPGFCSAT